VTLHMAFEHFTLSSALLFCALSPTIDKLLKPVCIIEDAPSSAASTTMPRCDAVCVCKIAGTYRAAMCHFVPQEHIQPPRRRQEPLLQDHPLQRARIIWTQKFMAERSLGLLP
jgi:hypothetical protein